MMNQINLMGRLTQDPELRHTSGGIAAVSFTLAVDRDYTTKASGEREVDFIDCTAWRGTALFVARYFSKGQMAAVSGRLQVRNWEDKNGDKRRSTEVVAENVYFAGSKPDRASEQVQDGPDIPDQADGEAILPSGAEASV